MIDSVLMAAKRAAARERSRAAFAKLKETQEGHLVESWSRFIEDATTTESALFEAVRDDAELRAAHDAVKVSTVVKTLASRIKKFFKLLEARGLVEVGKYGKKPECQIPEVSNVLG